MGKTFEMLGTSWTVCNKVEALKMNLLDPSSF